ncbi:hypothetical protein P154DRAFT_562204 [Amniculicola lignicola CBS 123094]|uniref:F-box domain-containing protein n=1 Tax=Amniculicola lignicola CBS 123094 TaxID=1392246 RepID=A0A6A5WJJ5_9PLEO|nr:hypothetical protein P154DRAFT_562204 [Amniculicola lignicola CBS 123094]
MGSWDCYCAICGGPLGTGLERGATSATALKLRRRRVEKKRARLLKGGDASSEHDESSDVEMDEGDESVYPKDDDGTEIDLWNEKHSYDPELLNDDRVGWLIEGRAIGFNAEATGPQKYFMTGEGSYHDYGEFQVEWESDDEPGGEYECYTSYNSNHVPVYPFHHTCYKILATAISGNPTSIAADIIKNDTLYSVMEALTDAEGGRHLNLDYGIGGIDQFWRSLSGEEYSVCDPCHEPQLRRFLRTKFRYRNFPSSLQKIDLISRVTHDPFSHLPTELHHLIFEYLSIEDLVSVIRASFFTFRSTQDNAFWKQRVRKDILPWFWELQDEFANGYPDKIDYKTLYLWSMRMTAPEFGQHGPLMGVANRRRIWSGPCKMLAEHYQKSAAVASSDVDDCPDEAAEDIWANSSSEQMPVIAFPKSRGSQQKSKQWVRSWDEFEHANGTASLSAFWNTKGHLVGLGVTFGGDCRVLGQDDKNGQGNIKTTVNIPAGEWIKGVTMHIRISNALARPPQCTATVEGLTVNFYDLEPYTFGNLAPELAQRVINTTGDTTLTGAVALTGDGGTISRLSLLQCERDSDEDEDASLPFSHRLLWAPSALNLPTSSEDGQPKPIWSHPTLRVMEIEIPDRSDYETPFDLVPNHVLLWATDKNDLKNLIRISAHEAQVGTVSSDRNGEGYKDCPIFGILGLGATFNPASLKPPVSIPDRETAFPGGEISHFQIDGPGGEFVTEIHVADEAKAIKLVTNRGRECFFGEEYQNHWSILKPGGAVGWGSDDSDDSDDENEDEDEDEDGGEEG